MIRHCFGEKPEVYEVTGATQAEVWSDVADIAENADHDGQWVTIGPHTVREDGTLEVSVYLS